MDYQDDDFFSTMYGPPDDDDDAKDKEKSPTTYRPPDNPTSKTRKISVGIVSYEVPNVSYVDSLEKRLIRLEEINKKQMEQIRRMDITIVRMRQDIYKVGGSINEVSRELDNKVEKIR